MLHLRQGDWQQMGNLFESVAGRLLGGVSESGTDELRSDFVGISFVAFAHAPNFWP